MLRRRKKLSRRSARLHKQREAAMSIRWSYYIKRRDKFACRMCGAAGVELEAAHIIPCTYRSTRWEPANGLTLCKWGCHRWAHLHPKQFEEWVREKLGGQQFDALRLQSRIRFSPVESVYQQIEDSLSRAETALMP
jgi:hypothetical protein